MPRLARDLDLLTLKVVSESRATSVPILVCPGLSVLDLRPDVRRTRIIAQ